MARVKIRARERHRQRYVRRNLSKKMPEEKIRETQLIVYWICAKERCARDFPLTIEVECYGKTINLANGWSLVDVEFCRKGMEYG